MFFFKAMEQNQYPGTKSAKKSDCLADSVNNDPQRDSVNNTCQIIELLSEFS